MNPYRIEPPFLLSFSGGRTSGYMLWHVLDAYDGDLPEDGHVCFANTGKERDETLRFVHECSTRWGVRIRWLERVRGHGSRDPAAHFQEVGFNSAARAGEPFVQLIDQKQMVPNPVKRFCSFELKTRTLSNFMRAQGHRRWTNAVGLRWDEMHRVLKQVERNLDPKQRWQTVMPMATQATKVRRQDVMAWWGRQPFDLRLAGYEGNCDMCFMKGEAILGRLMRENPGMADWWKEQEAQRRGITRDPSRSQFSARFSFADLEQSVQASPLLDFEDDEFDAECGLSCAGE